jgi:ribosomal protein S18 acetylase RimI-like enzyme
MSLLLHRLQQNIPPLVQQLYEESFPAKERRPWPQQLALVQANRLCLLYIEWDRVFVGMLTYWQLPAFVFIEHFAVTPASRGKGIGAAVIKAMQQRFPVLVLETETAAAGPLAVRRQGFYEKLGFTAFPFSYQQPPYIAGENSLPMLLMQCGSSTTAESFLATRQLVYQEVYGVTG